MHFKYLHAVGDGSFWLDHRLVPEVRGMFAAMASRAPVGGIKARYAQVVEAVAETLYEDWDGIISTRTWADAKGEKCSAPCDNVTIGDFHREHAENRLCEYPLHPKVQKFFDDFVGKYGHSSIMELTGSPAVYTEGISWFTAWQLFDSPLCAGQEFSTRAVQHADWPMARECRVTDSTLYEDCSITTTTDFGDTDVVKVEDVSFMFASPIAPTPQKFNLQVDVVKPHPDLVALHKDWFEVFEAEVAWWKDHLSDEANRLALGIGDKEPFRPALDRARWALPGTIATGCAHTTSLRERARVLKDGANLAAASHAPATQAVWAEITETYREALPGLAGMGLREAVYTPETAIPGHMRDVFSDAPDGPDAEVELTHTGGLSDVEPFRRKGEKSYLDVSANAAYRANVTFRCSLAVARDWHRHRTLFPWHLQVVRAPDGCISIDHHYEPKSDLAKAKIMDLLIRSTNVFEAYMAAGNVVQAALALPLGTRVRMRGQGGLRDVVYMLELRKYAHGANFEYKEQATTALDAVRAHWTYPDGSNSDAEGFGIVP